MKPILTVLAMLIFLPVVFPQDVPPPPRPAGSALTLDEITKQLQEEVLAAGVVSYTSILRDAKHDTSDPPMQLAEQVTGITARPRACQLDIQRSVNSRSSPASYYFEDMKTIEVMTLEDFVNAIHRLRGHSYLTQTITPVIYSVPVSNTEALKFIARSAVSEFAKTLQRAVASCQLLSPPTAGTPPNVEDTMVFIQQKLNSQGAVNWIWTLQNATTGSNGPPVPESRHTYGISADPAACRLNYQERWVVEDRVLLDGFPSSFAFRRVDRIQVISLQESAALALAARGQPERTKAISPEVSQLVVSLTNNRNNVFYFFDRDLADRVAKAMVHAVELCGGGSKDPF